MRSVLVAMIAAMAMGAHAAPPLGENLLADGSFEAPLEVSPWTAASGSQDVMLCPDEHCGSCFRRSGNGALRFEARDTDDVWIMEQQVTLPPADRYELTLYIAGCNGAPTGSIYVALGDTVGGGPIALDGGDLDEYRYFRFVFESSQVEGEVGSKGKTVALSIANPSLNGADVAVDDLRLVARNASDVCPTSEELMGVWRRSACHDVHHDGWVFSPDGTFSLTSEYRFEEGSAATYHGTYCVDATASPARISLYVDRACYFSDMMDYPWPDEACGWEAGPFCFGRCELLMRQWRGVFSITDGRLNLKVSECGVDSLENAPRYGREELVDTGGQCNVLEACKTLRYHWYANNCGEITDGMKYMRWRFLDDGTFDWEEHLVTGGVTTYTQAYGTYTSNADVTPHTLNLQVTRRCSKAAPSGTGTGPDSCIRPPLYCGWDTCSYVSESYSGIYVYEGDNMQLALSDACAPHTLEEASIYSSHYGFCSPSLTSPAASCEGEGLDGEEGEAQGEAENGEAEDPEGEAEVSISPSELIPVFGSADGDGSGTLSEAEALTIGIGAAEFNVLDLNDDGELGVAELLYAAGDDSPAHSLDTNLDLTVKISELLRIIQLYNAGGYSCAPLANSEDGYLPQPGETSGCPRHASDYNPADGVISLSELLRAIQLYSSGEYTRCESGEDGFCLGS